MALYGSNPLDYKNINNSTIKLDGVPMLFGNSKFVKNSDDVKFTADWFSKNYFSANSDKFTYFETAKLGNLVSSSMTDFSYKNSKFYPKPPWN